MKPDFMAVFASVEEGLRQLLQFVVCLDRVECRVVVEPRGQSERRVAGEGADFEHGSGANHAHEQFQQPPLQMARQHAGLHRAAVGFTVELGEQFRLG
jgi:hypothetical protein